MRIVQRCDLHPALIDQLGVAHVEPAILNRLTMQIGAGVRSGKRNLDRMRVYLRGKSYRFLNRLLGLAGQPKNEGSMNRDPELVTILGKAAGDVDAHPLL